MNVRLNLSRFREYLDQAQFHFSFLGNHRLIPRWFPRDADVGGGDTGDEENFAFRVFGNRGAHAAPGSGERHRDVDLVAALVDLRDFHAVDQAEVHDVDGNLRIENFAHLIPDGGGIGRTVGECGGRDDLFGDRFADRVGILAIEPEKAGGGLHRVAAAEDLVDKDGVAFEKRVFIPAGNLGGGDFAGEDAVAVGGGAHGRSSEEWVASSE